MAVSLILAFAALSLQSAGPAPTETKQSPPARVQASLRFAPPEQRAPVAYEAPSGQILFQARIAGREGWAMLDNGASRTVVDVAFARGAGLAVSAAEERMNTATGSVPMRRVASVPLVVPGQFETLAPEMAALDLTPMSQAAGRPIAAMLGGDFLNQLALGVDPAARTFRVGPSGSFRPPAAMPFVQLRTGAGRRPQIELQVGEQRLLVAIDLGYNGALSITPEAWTRVAPAGAQTGTSTFVQADGERREGRRGVLPEIRFGANRITGVPVTIARQNRVDAEGIIGMRVLGRVPFVLDAAQEKLWILPPRRPPATPAPEN